MASTLFPWGWGEFVVNTTTSGDQTGPSITALSNGGFIVVWTDNSASGGDTSGFAVRAQVYDPNGLAYGSEILVNTTTSGDQLDAKVTQLANGNFVVVWNDGSVTGDDTSGAAVRGQIFSLDGTKVGSEFLVNDLTWGSQYNPDIVARQDGGFDAIWRDDGASYFNSSYGTVLQIRSFDASGNALTGSTYSYNPVGWDSYAENAGEKDGVVAPLSNGNFVVAWTETNTDTGDGNLWSVKAQIFDGAATTSISAVTADFVVNTTTSGYQFAPGVTGLTGGGFVVTWIDGSQTGDDASSWAIRGQVFAADGTMVGSEFLVNTTVTDSQYDPTVTATLDGGFLVAWEDWSQNATNSADIRVQLFDANGNKQGIEYRLNAYTTGGQLYPDSATLADGRIVVVWQDGSGTGDASGYGIHAVIADPRGGVQTGPAQLAVFDTSNAATDMLASFTGVMQNATLIQGLSSSIFEVTDGTNTIYFFGTGLTYDANGAPLTGTVTNFGYYNGGAEPLFTGINITMDAVAVYNAVVAATGGNSAPLNTLLDGFSYTFKGGTGPDTLTGHSGDDLFIGGAGNDVISGGAGTDTAQYSGNWANYTITQNGDGSYHIVDTRSGSPNGTDTVSGVEQFQFANGTLTADHLLNTAPYDITLSKDTVVDQSIGGTVVATLSASDANSLDTFTYALMSDPSGYFAISGNQLVVKSGATVDIAAASSRDITLSVTDAHGLTYTETDTIQVVPSMPRWGSEIAVNTTTSSAQFGGWVTALADGRFVVEWTDYSTYSYPTAGTVVRGQVFNGDGTKAGGEFLLNPGTANNQNAPEISALPNGGFVTTWIDSAGYGQDNLRAQIFAPDGSEQGGEITVLGGSGYKIYYPAIQALPDGRFFVAWTNGNVGLYETDGQLFNADGTKSGSTVVISTGQGGAYPSIAALDDGRFFVVWKDAYGSGLTGQAQGQLFNADGSKFGSAFWVSDAAAGSTAATTLADGHYAIVFQDRSPPTTNFIGLQLFNPDGSRDGSEIQVSSGTLNSDIPFISTMPDGHFIVTYYTTSGLRGQLFNEDGTKSGNEFTIGTSVDNMPPSLLCRMAALSSLTPSRMTVAVRRPSPNLRSAHRGRHLHRRQRQ